MTPVGLIIMMWLLIIPVDNGNYTIHTNYNGTLFNKAYHGVDSLVIDDGFH